MRDLRPGDPTEIGAYRLQAHLGSGGMGTVYLASTPGGRLVALKSIRSELTADDEFRERFRLEVRAARRVRGLYTAELIDADPDAVPPWLVTAYVQGPSLAQAVKARGPVPAKLVPLLMAGVAEALLDVHSAGIVHRDLKPSNVLLSQDGPRVIDFGIAKALDLSRLTASGVTMGSPECMTPEQIRGLPITPAADIFSLGVLGAFAASGQSPFEAPNSAAMMYRVVHEAPVLDGVPADLRELLESCLAKEYADRPTPAELLARCRKLLPEKPAVFPQSWEPDADGGRPDLNHVQIPATGGMVPQPTSAPAPRSRPAAATWLMYVAAALAVAALAVGLATLPGLRTTIGEQHPGSTADAISAAVGLATAVACIRALTTAGTWLWAAQDTARGYRSARTVSYVAFAVTTLGLASSYTLGLTTAAVQVLTLAGWLAGLAAVTLRLFRRRTPR